MRLQLGFQEYAGTPEEIVDILKSEYFHKDRFIILDEFIAHFAQTIFKFTGHAIDIGEGATTDKCRKLLKGMDSINLARIIEE